jgi:DNA polymerase III subunit gamma/tau
MGLDTKHRPLRYEDVLGQETSIRVLKGLVAKGRGRWQSYLFAGPFGSGKTTLGRILVRALLCEDPVDGEPCDKCTSCTSILEYNSSDAFVEVDAATNSGKADIRAILDELQYATFSGRPRIYLFDEAHQLTPNALDALLKPLEEEIPGTQNKRLVCVFCTTEPERMRQTILSRCAPAFVVESLPPEAIVERLQKICDTEGIPASTEALHLIVEATECHIRDAFKAVEGVSALGDVDVTNVTSYLRLDLAVTFLGILETLGSDLPKTFEDAELALAGSSPLTCYARLAETAIMVYKVHLGADKPPVYLDGDRVRALGQRRGHEMIRFAEKFADRPGRPTPATLLCDLALLHHGGGLPSLTPGVAAPVNPSPPPALTPSNSTPAPPSTPLPELPSDLTPDPSPVRAGTVPYQGAGTVGVGAKVTYHWDGVVKKQIAPPRSKSEEMPVGEFCSVLRHTLREMGTASGGGSPG